MFKRKPMDLVDVEFYNVTKDFTINDWRKIRDDNYYWTKDRDGKEIPTTRAQRLFLIKYYLQHGERYSPENR